MCLGPKQDCQGADREHENTAHERFLPYCLIVDVQLDGKVAASDRERDELARLGRRWWFTQQRAGVSSHR